VFVATLANHALAVVGVWIGRRLSPALLDAAVGISMISMALWMLEPDKTQIATLALAAAYFNLFAVVAGTTCGMLAADAPVIFLGNAFAGRLPIRPIHYTTTILLLGVGAVFIYRAIHHLPGCAIGYSDYVESIAVKIGKKLKLIPSPRPLRRTQTK